MRVGLKTVLLGFLTLATTGCAKFTTKNVDIMKEAVKVSPKEIKITNKQLLDLCNSFYMHSGISAKDTAEIEKASVKVIDVPASRGSATKQVLELDYNTYPKTEQGRGINQDSAWWISKYKTQNVTLTSPLDGFMARTSIGTTTSYTDTARAIDPSVKQVFFSNKTITDVVRYFTSSLDTLSHLRYETGSSNRGPWGNVLTFVTGKKNVPHSAQQGNGLEHFFYEGRTPEWYHYSVQQPKEDLAPSWVDSVEFAIGREMGLK